MAYFSFFHLPIFTRLTAFAAGILLFFGVGAFPLLCAASVGVSPAILANDHLLAGSRVTYVVAINSGDLSTDPVTLVTSVEGDVQSWVTLSAETVTLSSAAPQVFLEVSIVVPTTTASGEYFGTIHIEEQASPDATGDLHSVVSLSLPLQFTVTSQQQASYTVSDLNVPTLEEGDPLFLYFTVDNTGNIPGGPDHATVIITTADEKRQLSTETTQVSSKVQPFTYATESAVFSRTLPVGEYWLHARVLSGTTEQHTRKLHLEVVPKGSLGLRLTADHFAITPSDTDPARITLTGVVRNHTTDQVVSQTVITVRDKQDVLVSVQTVTTLLQANEQKAISAILPVSTAGEYMVAAEVRYPGNGKLTIPDFLGYTVASTDQGMVARVSAKPLPLWVEVVKVIVFIVCMIMGGVFVWKKKSRVAPVTVVPKQDAQPKKAAAQKDTTPSKQKRT